MATITWDQVGERLYETGVDHGVLYLPNSIGSYDKGYAWNGLVSVSESPSGAEASPQYADNIKYLNLVSAEEFGATIEAFTYPEEFAVCDGTAMPSAGVTIGQQTRKTFGLSYRTLIGNDTNSTDHGYKLHLVYSALAAPTEKAYSTVNDSPEAITFSWEVSTTPVQVPGYKPTATLTVDSTKVDPAALVTLEEMLYGTTGTDPALPTPEAVMAIFGDDAIVEVVPEAPSQAANDITIPVVTGVTYRIDDEAVEGTVTISEDVVVVATPEAGYKFPSVSDNDWFFAFGG